LVRRRHRSFGTQNSEQTADRVLLSFAADPRNARNSEHEHFGPYGFLEVMTWPEAGFDNHAIRGTVADLGRLSALIEAKLATTSPGHTIRIQEEFAPDSPYALLLDSREDGYDPQPQTPY
jgi:hypothetical protein